MNNNNNYLQTLSSYLPSPYYLYAFVFDDEKYNPMLKYLLLELSPVITILYPTFYYLLPSSILSSLDDEFVITLISPIVLHVKRPEYHYQGIVSSATSIIYSSVWLLKNNLLGELKMI
ncbi:hypothetical protein Glove_208g109 [Diversispora epigaea]|uniref:Uncharacterized protein n=1 Tax=Diversispora epigaea TaxID=1348612 RepID=A0A397IJ14_9GLOM|nr:hypothetical protein Glove_208g109 [Diversispora epigaea]